MGGGGSTLYQVPWQGLKRCARVLSPNRLFGARIQASRVEASARGAVRPARARRANALGPMTAICTRTCHRLFLADLYDKELADSCLAVWFTVPEWPLSGGQGRPYYRRLARVAAQVLYSISRPLAAFLFFYAACGT